MTAIDFHPVFFVHVQGVPIVRPGSLSSCIHFTVVPFNAPIQIGGMCCGMMDAANSADQTQEGLPSKNRF
jgi:hypothetical protein